MNEDAVNHPKHYTSHPSGIEAIEIIRHYTYSVGNVFKYLWRAGLKNSGTEDSLDKEIEDVQKAMWYLNDHLTQLQLRKEQHERRRNRRTKRGGHRERRRGRHRA